MIWWHKILEIHFTMADVTPTSSTYKDVKQQPRILKRIDPDDPNNKAFELVTMFVLLLCCHESPFFLRAAHPPPPQHHSLIDNPSTPTPHLGGEIYCPG
jgi:hypothetical protein